MTTQDVFDMAIERLADAQQWGREEALRGHEEDPRAVEIARQLEREQTLQRAFLGAMFANCRSVEEQAS